MMDNDLIQEYLLEIERLSKIGTSLTGQERDGIFDLTGNLRRMGESFFLQFFPSAVQEMLRSAENGFLFLHTDDQLRQIPWELLHDGVCFLADKFYIGKNISGHWRDRQREERENLRVLIACDPTEDLEWARREGEGLFEALNSEVDPERLDIRFMSGRDITKLSLLDAMKDRDVVHYAGHVDPARTPGESGWPLSGGKILRTREIEKAGFSPDLVFANGCSVQRSLGESDVASAFLRAGIANFIGTNWEIRDSQNTLDFAVHFYRSIFEEKSLGESLFEARQFARRTYPPADLTWANYVLHGNPMARIYRSNRRFQVDMPAKKCIERDALRERKVGEGVILKMDKDLKVLKDTFDFSLRKKLRPQDMHHIRPLLFSETLPTAVIFDIDGTLALMGNRGPFDWFLVDRDDPNDVVMEHTRFHKAAGRTVILVSGRDEVCRSQTEFWLHFHSVKFDMLLMRKANDFRKDTLVKKEIYENHIAGKYNLLCVYDDRLQVLDTWYKLGVFTFNVNQGNHDF
jgi:hypothetical protein